MRVPLDAQNWAEIKPVEELTRADRIAVNDVIVYEGEPGTGRLIVRASADDHAATAILARVIVDWSFPIPIPSAEIKSLAQLSLAQDEALRAAVEPHLKAIQGKDAPGKENAVPTAGSAS